MTNELHRARSGSKTGGDSLQLTSYSELSTESTTELELSRPPLVVISSRMKSPDTLVSCVSTGVESVKYSYETTSLSKLFQTIGTKLKGRQALSIAFLVHGQPGCFKICSQKVVSTETLREDRELKEFFLTLTSSFLERESQYTRIDFLLCPVAQNPAGEQLLQQMKELLGVPVFASSEILGAYSSENGQDETGSVRIGKLYFDEEKLKEWTRQSQQTMASFEKIRTVGKGAHGAAVLYRKKDDDSRVILKEINLLTLTKAERKAALNEVKILSMLDHPNIISYYDNFEEDGVLMIEMEYADGGTLERHLKQRANPVSEQQTKPVSEQQAKPMSEQEILHMFSQMVDALKYLHDHNVLHRDLKTANIFLTKEGIVKLGDFGISKVLSDTNEAANTVLGTPFYISPEICEGSPYNAKSDIWALGCVLYEMACLQKTFEGTNLPALVHKIVQVSFAPVKGDYSDGLKQLIEDMLQKDPKSRPSASEICNTRLPQLKKNFHWKDNPAIPSNDDPNTDIMTSAKSFLYYLDGHSLLLRPLHAPINAKIDQVAVGFSHVIAVTNEHTVFSWGAGSRGQLGHGDITPRSTPQKIEALSGRGITRVKCGGEFSVFISDNDVIMSCGRGDMGALGHGDSKDCLKPRLIEALLSHDATAVSCGADHVVTLTSDSCVFAWGAGGHGRLGTGSEENCSTPMEITVHSPYSKMKEVIVDMRCGADGTMFLTPTGRVFACGNNHENKLGLNQRETFIMQMQRRILNKAQLQVPQALVPTPLKELGKHRVVDLSLGPTHTSVLVETGRVFTFGRNSEGQLCTGNCQPQNTPSVVKALHAKPMSVISSELSTIVTTEDNSFLIWGSRPLVKSPLTDILNENDIPQMKSTETDATKMRSISVTNEGKVSEDGQVPVDVNSSSLTGSSGHLGSCETTPEGKKSRNPSVEDVVIASPKAGSNDSIKRSNSSALSSESVDQSNSTLNEMQKKPSISNLLDAPHTLALCSEATKYLSQLGDLLAEGTETTKVKGGGAKHRESFPSSYQLQTRSLKRGMSISSCDFVSPEGVIMKPTAIDLVGKSGILSSLSTQGFRNVKVEGISCFGCNMLVLIQAQELLESSAPVSSEERGTLPETSVKIGRNLSERRARSTRHTVSSAEPSPPPSTQSSPHPGFHGDATTRSIDTTISEDSQIPTWIQRELQEAMNEQKAKSENAKKRTSACMMQAEFPTESVSESESKVMPPTRMFVASKEDISHAQNQRVSLPGSMNPESRQVELEPDPAKVGKSNPDVVVTNEQGKLVKHPRNETVHEMQNKQLSPYQGSSSPSRPSVSKSSKSDSETPATQTESKVKLNSGVIRSTIPEHNRKGVSLATVDKAEQLAEQKAKAAKETSPRRLRVAASTTNISQAPSNTSALNLKRTRSNTDVTSPINKPASKNLSHAKLSSRQSMPVGKSGIRFTSHVRGSSEPTPKPSTGVRSHASVNRAPVPGRLPPVQVQKGEHRKSNKELRHSTHGESSLSPQTSSGSLRGNPATKRSNQLREGMMKHSEEGGGASCVDSTPHEQLSSSSEGEVFIAPGKGTKNVSSSLKPTGRKLMKQQHRTGHAIAVTDVSPYEDPAPRIRRPSGGRTHSRSSTGNRQTREDGSNKVEVSAVQQSEESEEQGKAEQERAQHELEEREQEQLRLSQQREEHAQLQEEIQRLQSEVTKQETQLQENANLVKNLQKQVEQLQAKATDSPPSSPSRKRRWPRRGSQRREDTNKNTNRTKSSICTVM